MNPDIYRFSSIELYICITIYLTTQKLEHFNYCIIINDLVTSGRGKLVSKTLQVSRREENLYFTLLKSTTTDPAVGVRGCHCRLCTQS
jgi:hypothetical protein